MEKKQSKFFYGWIVVLVAFLSVGITYGTKGAYGVIQLSMLNDLGWSRTQVAGAFSANMFVYAIVVLFVGKIMDKVGVKNILAIGGVLTGLAYYLMTVIKTPTQFYLCYGLLLGVAGSCMGMVPGPTAVGRWFVKKRGRAMAITLVASPLGAAIFTMFAKGWLESIGWRGTFKIMAITSWILVIIPSLLLMKNKPEDIGLLPDGEIKIKVNQNTNSCSIDDEEWTYKKIFCSPKAWALILAYFLFGGNGLAQQIHQVPHLINNGLTETQATDALAMNMFLSMFSMLIWPTISDFIDRKKALCISLILQIIGTIVLMNANTPVMAYVFVFIMGLSYMGAFGLFSSLTADLFGRKSLGTLNGVMATSASIGSAVAIYFGGYIYDVTKSYTILWSICIGGLVLATLFTIFLIKSTATDKSSNMIVNGGK
ncbi:MFS transporter [Clostridium brassicae]|uniref:MFS transporter n=1 Tax=Clostridium brassicae TaxID=2999072 RepID=A0ABT4DD79_9CLOT|nr:MFS transporter [Clostridium brassicae]MCY6960143.1 MFS transporter [Clostridium brassicae]